MSFQKRIVLAVIVVAIVSVSGYFLSSNILSAARTVTHNVPASQNNFFLSLSDPATVPSGTTALFVKYSALQLSVLDNGSTLVRTLPGSGTVNVLDLQNASIVLAVTSLPNGSKVTQIKVNISGAVITIGGQNSSVVIGESTITVNLTNNNTISGQKSAIIDLVPSVTAIETVDKTIYVLTPSVRAVMTPENVFAGRSINVSNGGQLPPPQVGEKQNFVPASNLTNIFRTVTPTIKITAASIAVSGNTTSISLTVKNTGNTSVELNGVLLNGSKKVYFPAPPANLLFRMPAMVFPMPIIPPSSAPLPSNYIPPPKFVITLPNGTVMNTTATFNLSRPSFNGSLNGSTQPPQITGKFYLLDLVHPAEALLVNSTGALVNISGDRVIVTTTIQSPPQPNQSSSNPQQGPMNVTIPPGSVIINLPISTTLYIQFPQGMKVPSPTLPANVTLMAQNMPIGRMIFSNGSLGFPPLSLTRQSGQISSAQGSGSGVIGSSANQGASSVISEGVSNISVQLPPGVQIPKGYDLGAGDSVTLTLSGLLTLGPAPQTSSGQQPVDIQPPFAVLIADDLYNIGVFGEGGSHAITQVTAST